MDLTTIALVAMFAVWLGAGFTAWLPWVVFNGQHRPLTRLWVALAAGLGGALLVPAVGLRDAMGLFLSPVAAFGFATLASYGLHRWLGRRRTE